MTYVKPSIANYNDDAPSDDGSATSSNKIKWSKIKDELTDPLKSYIDAVNNAAETGFLQRLFSEHETKVANFTPSSTSDDGKLFVCTSALTATLPVASDATEGYMIGLLNITAGTVTVDGDGSETINGSATFTSTVDYELILCMCTGTGWYAVKIPSINSPVTVKDSNFTLQDNGDVTKQVKFELSGITTATIRTFTVPDASTTVVGTDVAQTLTNKTLSTGTVYTVGVPRQIVQTIVTSATSLASSTGNTFTDLGLSVTITPRSTNSKILVKFAVNMGLSVGNDLALRMVRDSTPIAIGDSAGSRVSCTINSGLYDNESAKPLSFEYLDSPSTTSAVTYKLQYSHTGGTAFLNRSATDTSSTSYYRSASTITVQEIEG